MAKYTKEQAISVVVSCAEKYRNELQDRALLIVSQDKHKKQFFQEVFFYDRNFLHLTGLKFKKGNVNDEFAATNFYGKCLSHSLSPADFEFADDGTTFLKLDVLPALISKNLAARMLGDYNATGPKLYTEKLAGNVNACMGFIADAVSGNYVPNTVLNEDIRNRIRNQMRIIAIFRTKQKSDIFEEITYMAKGVDLAAIDFPEHYRFDLEGKEIAV